MASQLSGPLRSLLTAMNLGRSTNHPLGGWQVLMILYRDGSTTGEPMTMRYLVDHYNSDYLEPGEPLTNDDGLRPIVKVLVAQAHLVAESTRKVRERMNSGKFHITQSSVYRINAAGIEYLKAMRRVIDAENTVVASTKRITEYCQLVKAFQQYDNMSTTDMQLYEDFNRMLSAYDEVTQGLRKLDVDLHDISTDLAFDRLGDASLHLQKMLHEQAIPAYTQMIKQAALLRWLSLQEGFGEAVALSRQAKGNLDVAVAIGDESALESEREKTKAFVQRRLASMIQSFDPSTSAIQTSFDSIYLLYQTLNDASQLLAREYEHVRRQKIDLRALTDEIDQLITKTSRLTVPQALPLHLPMDRLSKTEMAAVEELPRDQRADKMADLTSSVRADMLEAGTMEPVTRPVTEAIRNTVTAADNPEAAEDGDLAADEQAAIQEFATLTMTSSRVVEITHNLEFTTQLARDAVVALYPATQYVDPAGFGVFGRSVEAAAVTSDHPIQLHLQGELFAVTLPHSFRVTFQKEG